MNDERLRQAYEAGLNTGSERGALDDVAAERLRRLVEGEGSDEERLRTLDQQFSSANGRREVELLWAAERAARPRTRVRRRLIAASALVAVGLSGTWLAMRKPMPESRGDRSPLTLVAPSGTRQPDEADRFVWRGVSEAVRYTLVLVDTTGAEVYAVETGDTVVTLPQTVHLEPGRSYLWWVQAKTRYGASITAVTERLTISAR